MLRKESLRGVFIDFVIGEVGTVCNGILVATRERVGVSDRWGEEESEDHERRGDRDRLPPQAGHAALNSLYR